MKKITRYFFEGLLLLVPLVVTVYVIFIIFKKIDSIFEFKVPGAGVLITLVTITLVGFISSNILTRKLVSIIEKTVTRLPFVKMIYTAMRDLMNAFVGDKKSFNKPVLVAVSADRSINVIGFMTKDSLASLGHADKAAVYLPESYNFAGNLIIVSKDRITSLPVDSGDVMAFIVSGGVAMR